MSKMTRGLIGMIVRNIYSQHFREDIEKKSAAFKASRIEAILKHCPPEAIKLVESGHGSMLKQHSSMTIRYGNSDETAWYPIPAEVQGLYVGIICDEKAFELVKWANSEYSEALHNWEKYKQIIERTLYSCSTINQAVKKVIGVEKYLPPKSEIPKGKKIGAPVVNLKNLLGGKDEMQSKEVASNGLETTLHQN